jgi:hypothetical protein
MLVLWPAITIERLTTAEALCFSTLLSTDWIDMGERELSPEGKADTA